MDYFLLFLPKFICAAAQKTGYCRNRGCKALEQHAESSAHIEKLQLRRSNYSMKGMFGTGSGKTEPQNLNPKIEAVNVPMCDRIGNLEVSCLLLKLSILFLEGDGAFYMFLLNCIRHPTPSFLLCLCPTLLEALGHGLVGEQIGFPIRGTPAHFFFRC